LASLFVCGRCQAWGLGLTWAFLFLSLFALAISRALNVYPLAAAVNFMRPKEVAIPRTHQHMLWFSGLRGAIAFALSLSAAADLGGKSSRAI
jgi:NhaP-type Na+/H+ or K+/H+ antiporter